jgi:hypothetical protein
LECGNKGKSPRAARAEALVRQDAAFLRRDMSRKVKAWTCPRNPNIKSLKIAFTYDFGFSSSFSNGN